MKQEAHWLKTMGSSQVKCMLFPLDEIHCAQKVLQIVT